MLRTVPATKNNTKTTSTAKIYSKIVNIVYVFLIAGEKIGRKSKLLLEKIGKAAGDKGKYSKN